MIVPKWLMRPLLIGCIIILGASVITLGARAYFQQQALDGFWQKMTEQEQSISKLEDANGNQKAVIDELASQRERDADAVEQLLNSISDLARQDETTRNRLHALEVSNAQTRAYLDGLVDPAVSCMLDPACDDDQRAATDRPAAADEPDAVVQPAD